MTIVAEASSSAGGYVTTLTINKPTGTVSGNVLVATLCAFGARTMTPPSGWVLVASGTASGPSAWIYYLVCGGSEPASYDWTIDSQQSIGGGITRYSGVDTTTPSDVAASANTGTSQSPIGLSITTATANAMLVMGIGANVATASYAITQASGFTEEWEINTGRNTELADVIQASAGASGDKTGSIATGSTTWRAFLWALRPATSGTVFNRSNSLSISTSQSVARTGAFARTQSLTGSISESVVRVWGHGRANAMTGSLSISVARIGIFGRSKTQLGNIAPTVARTGIFGRAQSITGSISPTLTHVTAHIKALSQTGSVSQALSKVSVYGRSITRPGQLSTVLYREGQAVGDSLEWTYVNLKLKAAKLIAAVLHLPRSDSAARRDS